MSFFRSAALAVVTIQLGFLSQVYSQEGATTGNAGTQTPVTTDTSVEKLEVTGSLIRRIDMEGPSQVIVIDREQIENSGYNEVGSLLRTSTVSPFGSSSDRANLKGLGSARTLVLINGQRIPAGGDSYESGTNVNVIPLAAVERIEILKEGASSTYGSDALAGVVNIITRKNFSGRVVAAKLSVPSQPGGATLRASAAYGGQSEAGSLLTSIQFITNTPIKASDRNYLQDINDDYFFSSNYTDDTGNVRPAPGCTELDNTGRCAQKLASEAVTETGYDFSAYVNYKYEVDSELEVFSDLILRHGISNTRNFEATITGLLIPQAQVPANWDTLPGRGAGSNAVIFHRIEELPKRTSTNQSTSAGWIVGAKGVFDDSDWEWKLSNNIHGFMTDDKDENYGLRAPITAAIIAGDYDPFGANKDTTGFTGSPFTRTYYLINTTQFTANGELGESMGAVWSAGAGVFAQFSEYKDEREQRVLDGEYFGLGGTTGGGNRAVGAVFAEVNGLFGKSVELQLSLRHDQYDDFGGTTNPKFATRWKATNDLMFRASAGTGFQAPTLQDTYGPKLEGFIRVIDTKNCDLANNDPSNDFCQSKSYAGEQGANPDLTEETSIAYSIGTVYQPIQRLSFSADYYTTKIEDVVASDVVGLLELESKFGPAAVAKYGGRIDRNAVTDEIEFISAGLRNFATQEIQGIDLGASYTHPFNFGDITFRMDHTIQFHYFEESYEELGKEDILGDAGVPRWKNVVTINWSSKDNAWGASLAARTTADQNKLDEEQGKTPIYTEADMQVNYKADYGKFQLGFTNLFDTQPEFDDSVSSKFDSTLYSRFRVSYFQFETTF